MGDASEAPPLIKAAQAMRLTTHHSRPSSSSSISSILCLAVCLSSTAEEVRPVSTVATSGVPEIVVTATRLDVSRDAVPASVSVVDRETLQFAPGRNVDDALRRLAGVTVVRSYGMGAGIPSQINLRGVPGLHGILLMLDGEPLSEAYSGFQGVNEVPDAAIRRVEVVRGPFSALYGADAFAGVVQILTDEPTAMPGTEVSGSAGNEGYRHGSASSRGRLGGTDYLVALDARSIDNYLASDEIIESHWDAASGRLFEVRRPAENFDYSDSRALARLGRQVGESSRLTVHGRLYDGHLGYGQTDLRSLYPAVGDNKVDTQTQAAGADVDTVWSDELRSRATLAYRRQERGLTGLNMGGVQNGQPVFVTTHSKTDTDNWRAGGQVSAAFSPGNRLTGGLDLEQTVSRFHPATDASNGMPLSPGGSMRADVENAGLFAQDEAAILPRLSVVTGARLDSHSEFGEVLSPKAAMLYRAAEGTLARVSVGRAYRAPSLLELFQPDVSYGNYVFHSNPGLKPEYIVSADAGIEQRFSDRVRAHLDVFYNDMSDLISRRTTGTSITFENVDEAWSAGAEAGVDVVVCDGLTLFVNYTRQQSEDRATGFDLAYIPENIGNAGMRGLLWRGGVIRVDGMLAEQYIGTRGYVDGEIGMWRELDAYWRTDASLRATWKETIWVGAGAQNLANTMYQEASTLNPAPRCLWQVEAGIRW